MSRQARTSKRKVADTAFEEWLKVVEPLKNKRPEKLTKEELAELNRVISEFAKPFVGIVKHGFTGEHTAGRPVPRAVYDALVRYRNSETQHDRNAAAYNVKYGLDQPDAAAPNPAPEALTAAAAASIDPVTGEYKADAINMPDPKETGAVKPRLTDAQKKAKTLEERYNAWGSGTKKDFDALLEQLATSDKPDEGTLTKWMDAQNKAAAAAGNAGLRAISFNDVMDMANAKYKKRDQPLEEQLAAARAVLSGLPTDDREGTTKALNKVKELESKVEEQRKASAAGSQAYYGSHKPESKVEEQRKASAAGSQAYYGSHKPAEDAALTKLQQELADAEMALAELRKKPNARAADIFHANAVIDDIKNRIKDLEKATNKPAQEPKPKKEFQHTGYTPN